MAILNSLIWALTPGSCRPAKKCGALFCPERVSMDFKNPKKAESLISLFEKSKYVVLPGFADVHVHLRQPGFSYKETIKSGTMAAAKGGYTAVCAMPNLNPTPDSIENLTFQLDIIKKDAVVFVYPYGTITKGEKGETLSDMEDISNFVCGFSDDGRGVEDDFLMEKAMEKAKALGKIIAAHCEYKDISVYDSESEWKMLERDIRLAIKTGCAYHACHISAKESVKLIRQAKAAGIDVSCEVTPHHLLLDDTMVKDDGRYKMNPPLRSRSDRQALIEGLCDGTIDIVATDHAPHSADEKSRGFDGSAFGIVGLETAFPLLYTHLVKTGSISLERLIQLMSHNPRKRFGIKADIGFTVFDLNSEYYINPKDFISMGKSTPFEGFGVNGKCMATSYNGNFVWLSPEIKKLADGI
jgi:dihydroorotase